MTKYRLNQDDFKDIIVDAETKREAIKELIPLLNKEMENNKYFYYTFIDIGGRYIRIEYQSKREGATSEPISKDKVEVEEISEELFEKETTLREERKRIASFRAIPAREISASNICDFFGENWYTMTLCGQKNVAEHIAKATGVDFKIAFEWLENILERWT